MSENKNKFEQYWEPLPENAYNDGESPRDILLNMIPTIPMVISNTQLLSLFGRSKATLSHHLNILLMEQKVRKFRKGNTVLYQRVNSIPSVPSVPPVPFSSDTSNNTDQTSTKKKKGT